MRKCIGDIRFLSNEYPSAREPLKGYIDKIEKDVEGEAKMERYIPPHPYIPIVHDARNRVLYHRTGHPPLPVFAWRIMLVPSPQSYADASFVNQTDQGPCNEAEKEPEAAQVSSINASSPASLHSLECFVNRLTPAMRPAQRLSAGVRKV